MACAGCSITKEGSSGGCGGGCSSGGCSTGGCNRLNTYDWLSDAGIQDVDPYHLIEATFKNGSRKDFFKIEYPVLVQSGDWIVVDTGGGYDVGRVSLTGELVRLQMKKKKITETGTFNPVIRKANERDLERLQEARMLDNATLVKARAIARSIGLDMKLGDVEYQGDLRKATFYFTADGRVDFRELIRHYAKDFRVKIEMRQIGSRQESARIGGIGSCGRELCCSTWLTDFKSVATVAARYQNLAINQAKLSGQCGRLKCCLNFELDAYIDALKQFPPDNFPLRFALGNAHHVKTDIFKGLMYYNYEPERGRPTMIALEKEQVREIQQLNKKGEKPTDPMELQFKHSDNQDDDKMDYADVTGAVELPDSPKRKKKKKKKKNFPDRRPNNPPQ